MGTCPTEAGLANRQMLIKQDLMAAARMARGLAELLSAGDISDADAERMSRKANEIAQIVIDGANGVRR